MKSLTGFLAIIQGVSMQNMNQMWISWNPDSWKAHFSSKFVDFVWFTDHVLYLLFIQVYKAIFTSPSSARNISEDDDNAENMPPAAKSQRTSSGKTPMRRNVASKVNLNDKVTPRSIAYAAVQVSLTLLVHVVLCLFLVASSILTCKLQVHGPQFMEDLTTKGCIIILLMSSKIPLGLQQRSVPKNCWTGGQCKYYSLFLRILN